MKRMLAFLMAFFVVGAAFSAQLDVVVKNKRGIKFWLVGCKDVKRKNGYLYVKVRGHWLNSFMPAGDYVDYKSNTVTATPDHVSKFVLYR